MKKLLIIVLFLLLGFRGFSFHIVGGEMIYKYLGNDKYQVILKIYRDCAAANASAFDGTSGAGPAYLTVYDAANFLIGVYDIGSPVIKSVPPAFNNPCILAPNNICIQEGIYTDTLDLLAKAGGYTLVYQRCCRNSIIGNLLNPDGQGATYFAKIPGSENAASNNSPSFTKFPPIYICGNVPLRFDHSAIDPDGDQLVYSLCSPYIGMDACCASINGPISTAAPNCISPPSSCPSQASPPPYTNVLFSSPYSGTYPIDSNPAFSINPVTGELSGTPTLTGQYVVGVCAQEIRNGKLLNTHFRDFQFTVIGCTVTVLSSIADFSAQCQGNEIVFSNQSINQSSTPVYHWDFGVPSLTTDTSNLLNPTYLYPDTGIYILNLITNPGRPCTDTLKKPIYVYPPLKIKYPKQDRQCFRNNAFNFKAEGVYLPQAKFEWDFTSFATPPSSIFKNPGGIHFLDDGLFYVKLRAKQFACRDSFIDSIRVIGRPVAKINNLASGLCDPATIGFSNGSSCDLPLKHHWIFSNGKTSDDFEPTQVFTPAGIYSATLIVETTKICTDNDAAVMTDIKVNPKPRASFTITPKETSIFEPEVTVKSFASDAGLNSYFTFGDGLGSALLYNTHEYAAYGTYKITQTVRSNFGCIDSVSDYVKILPEFRFWIPNCFTPDDNALNDFFMPSTFGIRNYEFEIFDRWGHSIFKTNSSAEGWNGSYKGKQCQQGIYIWKISFKNIASEQTEVHLGNVTLIRNP